ncbi:MAG: M28 family peptidase, partial [Pyrinomonadaceae bacterium]
MRKLISSLVMTSLLVVAIPSFYAQRRIDKSKKAAPVSTTVQRGTDTISAAQLKDYLSFIASDEMEGRDTPSRGLDTTAKFLATNLSRWGFKPAGDNGTFFQRIDLRRDRVDSTQTRVEYNGRTLVAGTEYLPIVGSGSVSGQLIFAGNGWFIKAKQMDPYQDLDATGKIAVVAGSPNSLPKGLSRADLSGKQGEDWMNATDYARKKGVVGLVYFPDFQYLANWDRNRQRIMERGTTVVAKFQNQTSMPLPSVVISPELANALFQGEKQNAVNVFNGLYGPTGATPFALNPEKKLTMSLTARSETIPTQNVVAVWEGSDPVLKDEYVALGAHYDHVGIGIPVHGDAIYNGADDDGSGTTSLLGMAEALARAPSRPKRSVLFVWHCGEEKGLWGSRYFTENPTVPLD